MAISPKYMADAPTSLLGEGFIDVVDAGKYLGLSRSKVYALMDNQELAYAKFGKSRRIPIQSLRDYANRCLVGARAAETKSAGRPGLEGTGRGK